MATIALDPVLDGRWAYTIQGLMQWMNPEKLTYEPRGALEVGLAFEGVPGAAEYQKLPGFTPIPLTAINLEPFWPILLVEQRLKVKSAPALRTRRYQPHYLPGQGPPDTGAPPSPPSLPPISGYLPFAESGRIDFSPDGTLEGSIWFTVAGLFIHPVSVTGRFKVNPVLTDVPPVGVISFVFDNPPTHFNWDYSFIMVSNDEAQLITAGRLPRPATGSGTMKRCSGTDLQAAPSGRAKIGAPARRPIPKNRS